MIAKEKIFVSFICNNTHSPLKEINFKGNQFSAMFYRITMLHVFKQMINLLHYSSDQSNSYLKDEGFL